MKTYICEPKNCFGTTEGDLKLSIIIIKSHSHPVLIKSNTTMKYNWSLKDKGKNFIMKWSIAETARSYTCGTKWCDLCVTEKLLSAKANPKKLLKKQSEAISSCCQRMKYTLRCLR